MAAKTGRARAARPEVDGIAFAIPSTSGRAALALPVFAAMAAVLAPHRRVVLAPPPW
jgi:hypothetical protein